MFRRGTARRTPTIDNPNHPMEMVGHDDDRAQFNMFKPRGDLQEYVTRYEYVGFRLEYSATVV